MTINDIEYISIDEAASRLFRTYKATKELVDQGKFATFTKQVWKLNDNGIGGGSVLETFVSKADVDSLRASWGLPLCEDQLQDHDTKMKVSELIPHPLNEKLYGERSLNYYHVVDLMESIRKVGILEPILVKRSDDDNNRIYIVSGHRRVAAAKQIGLEEVPVTWFNRSDIDAEHALIEANRQREKTGDQKAKETYELLRIQKALAAKRRAATLKQNQNQNQTDVPSGSTTENTESDTEVAGRAVEIVAKMTSQSKKTVTMQCAIVEAFYAGTREGKWAMSDLEDGKPINAAYKTVRPKPEPKPQPEPKPEPEPFNPTNPDSWEYPFKKRYSKEDLEIMEEAEKIISAGKKSRAKTVHSDITRGSDEEMKKVNLAAEWLLKETGLREWMNLRADKAA